MMIAILSGLVVLLPLLAVGLVAALLVRARRVRGLDTVGQVAASGAAPADAHRGWPRGSWRAAVFSGGGLRALSPERGQIEIYGGWVAWVPDGHGEPEWTVPACDLRGRKNLVGTGDIVIESGRTGKVRLTVSHEKVRVWSHGTPSDLRQTFGYADEFLRELAGSGAQVS